MSSKLSVRLSLKFLCVSLYYGMVLQQQSSPSFDVKTEVAR